MTQPAKGKKPAPAPSTGKSASGSKTTKVSYPITRYIWEA